MSDSILTAADAGDQKGLLMVIRNSLIDALDDEDNPVPPRDLSALVKRLQDVLTDLVELDSSLVGDQLVLLKKASLALAMAISSGPPPRELAPLTRRLQDVVKEIATLKERGVGQREAENNGDSDSQEDQPFDIGEI